MFDVELDFCSMSSAMTTTKAIILEEDLVGSKSGRQVMQQKNAKKEKGLPGDDVKKKEDMFGWHKDIPSSKL